MHLPNPGSQELRWNWEALLSLAFFFPKWMKAKVLSLALPSGCARLCLLVDQPKSALVAHRAFGIYRFKADFLLITLT